MARKRVWLSVTALSPVLGAVLWATLAMAAPSSQPAATITVTSTIDAVDTNPGDGVCADGTGNCTLRAAIMEANALPSAHHYPSERHLRHLHCRGWRGRGRNRRSRHHRRPDHHRRRRDHHIIDGNALDCVFHVLIGSTVDISGVTVQNGNVRGDDFPANVGGILNNGTLTLTDSTVISNSSSGVSPNGTGGRIFNTGTLTLTNSTVSANTSNSAGAEW